MNRRLMALLVGASMVVLAACAGGDTSGTDDGGGGDGDRTVRFVFSPDPVWNWLEDEGIQVLRIWATAPRPVAMRRLINRKVQRAPVTPEEAAEIYDLAVARAKHEQFDVSVDTTSPPDPVRLAETLQHLLKR